MEEYKIIGKLDSRKLKYKENIINEEVILTEERKEHIKERHEQQYDELSPYLGDVIQNPDYILKEQQHSDTIILLKEIISGELRIKLIIKLAIGKDKGKKHSIITFWKIRLRDYMKTIDKSEIIYQKVLDKNE